MSLHTAEKNPLGKNYFVANTTYKYDRVAVHEPVLPMPSTTTPQTTRNFVTR